MQLRMKEGNRMSSKFPWMRVAKIAFPIVLLLFVFYQGKKELAGLSIKESIAAINQIPQGGFYLAVAVGLIAVSTMFFYDYILIRALKLKVSVWKIFRVSWIANSFNGVLGFRGLAGASLRAVLFREHTKDSPQLIRSIAWMAPSLMSGLSLLSLLVIVDVFRQGLFFIVKSGCGSRLWASSRSFPPTSSSPNLKGGRPIQPK